MQRPFLESRGWESSLLECEEGLIFMTCHQRDVTLAQWKWGERCDEKVGAVLFRDETYDQAYQKGASLAEGAGSLGSTRPA